MGSAASSVAKKFGIMTLLRGIGDVSLFSSKTKDEVEAHRSPRPMTEPEQQMHAAERQYDVAYTRDKMHQTALEKNVSECREAEAGVGRQLESMGYDAWLEKKLPLWEKHIKNFVRAHEDEETRASYCPSVVGVADEILQTLEKAQEMPEGQLFSACVILFHPCDRGRLKVFASDHGEACIFPRSYSFDERHIPSEYRTTCVDVWHVIHTGVPMLPSNPMATDVMGHSLVPLLESNGRCFGVLLSGSPKANPAPNELLLRLSKVAGLELERTWKLQNVGSMIKVCTTWLQKVVWRDQRTCEVHWNPGAKSKQDRKQKMNAYEWEPLRFHSGESMKHFEMELLWRDPCHAHNEKHSLGTLCVDCTGMSEMDDQMVELLHTTAPLIQKCVDDIAAMHVFDPCPMTTSKDMRAAFAESRMLLPTKLQAEMRRQLHMLDEQILHELVSYEHVSEPTTTLFKGVLILLGHDREALKDKTWTEIKFHLHPHHLIEKMTSVDLTTDSKDMKKRWCDSIRETKTLDFKALIENEAVKGAPLRIFVKWLMATRMVHQVVLSIQAEGEEHIDEHMEGKGVGEVNQPGKQKHKVHHHAATAGGGHHAGKHAHEHAKGHAKANGAGKHLPPLNGGVASSDGDPLAKPVLSDCGARDGEDTFEQIMAKEYHVGVHD